MAGVGADPDLVGRPLVHFFNANDQVNENHSISSGQKAEDVRIDARVWNPEGQPLMASPATDHFLTANSNLVS